MQNCRLKHRCVCQNLDNNPTFTNTAEMLSAITETAHCYDLTVNQAHK